MLCEGCGNKHAARIEIGYSNGKKWEICNECGKVPAMWMPDVYLAPGETSNENLCDKQGRPIEYSTKREKAAVMNMLKLRQADSAERQHGYRNESHLNRKTYFI